MLTLACGMPKSASTYVFEILVRLCDAQSGESLRRDVPAYLPPPYDSVFQRKIDTALLTAVDRRWPRERALALKTHDSLHPEIGKALAEGRVKAAVSFRDPRDAALSILDAGRRERETGQRAFFSQWSTLAEVEEAMARMLPKTAEWLRAPNVLIMPFTLVASRPEAAMRRAAAYTGLDAAALEPAPDRRAVSEFNQGRLHRHRTEMSADDNQRFLDRFGDYIAWFKALELQSLRETGRHNR